MCSFCGAQYGSRTWHSVLGALFRGKMALAAVFSVFALVFYFFQKRMLCLISANEIFAVYEAYCFCKKFYIVEHGGLD